MKNHLIIWTASDKGISELPFWGDLIERKHPASFSFFPEVLGIFQKYALPVIYSTEYKPKNGSWSADEVESGLNNVFRVILKKNTSFPDALIREIALVPYVKRVKRGDIAVADIPPSAKSMALAGFEPFSQIYLKEAHAFTRGHPQIKIAVLDTGIDSLHPEIAHAMLPGMDFVDILNGADKFIGDYLGIDSEPEDEVGHGTHVCGILAARGLKMPMGVAPKCRIIPVRVLGALKKGQTVVGAGLVDNISNGIKYAVDAGADVINMSLGVKHEGGGLPHEEVVKYALSKKVTIVAASGNDGSRELYYPGALPRVVAVGAVDQNDQVAGFSTYGSHVSFVAPGTSIVSTFPENKYSISSGTSQASPYVAGAVALLKSYALKLGRSLQDNQIKYVLKHTSDRLGSQYKDIKSGYGRINLLDALKLLQHKLSEQKEAIITL